MNDLLKLKLVSDVSKIKVSRKHKNATPDEFNGYGKVRNNQNVYYGYFTHLKDKSGIYCITCEVNNQNYIGSSKDIYKRVVKHYINLSLGNHPNKRLQADYNKYGIDKFKVSILEETNENLFKKEGDYQKSYGLSKLYNPMIEDTCHSDSQSLARATQSHGTRKTKTKEFREMMRKLKSNRIGQFDRHDGHKIAEYENSDEACKASGLAKSTLLGCCNGSKKTGKGYIWHYLDDAGNVITSGKGKERIIMVRNEDIV